MDVGAAMDVVQCSRARPWRPSLSCSTSCEGEERRWAEDTDEEEQEATCGKHNHVGGACLTRRLSLDFLSDTGPDLADDCDDDYNEADFRARLLERSQLLEHRGEHQIAWGLDGCPCYDEEQVDLRVLCQQLNERYERGSNITDSPMPSCCHSMRSGLSDFMPSSPLGFGRRSTANAAMNSQVLRQESCDSIQELPELLHKSGTFDGVRLEHVNEDTGSSSRSTRAPNSARGTPAPSDWSGTEYMPRLDEVHSQMENVSSKCALLDADERIMDNMVLCAGFEPMQQHSLSGTGDAKAFVKEAWPSPEESQAAADMGAWKLRRKGRMQRRASCKKTTYGSHLLGMSGEW